MIGYDKFAAKNAASARNWSQSEKKTQNANKKKTSEPTLGVCDRCHQEKLVFVFKTRRTERMEGAATYGTVVKHYCEECSPKNRRDEHAPPAPTTKQVKNLLRGAKKLL